MIKLENLKPFKEEVFPPPFFFINLLSLNTIIEKHNYMENLLNLNSEEIISELSFEHELQDEFKIDNLVQPEEVEGKILLNKVDFNLIQSPNEFLLSINKNLSKGDYFLLSSETYEIRKRKILKSYPANLNWVVYFFDFLIQRVLPKFKMTKILHSFFFKNDYKLYSRSEILGRLYFLGFELVKEKKINNKWYFVVKKTKNLDTLPEFKVNKGLFIRLSRVGKNERELKVYKLRTMHPYSEFIQEYVYNKYGTTGDKANYDFRIPTWGKILRKFWIDELPMIINLLKGDIKLIGVRPISKTKFNSYPEYLQKKRVKSKPGLLPPYYADNPNDLKGFYDCENHYLNKYFRNPLKCDLQYFFKILNSILIKGKRSA